MATIPLIAYPVSSPYLSTRLLCEAWWSCYSDPPHIWRIRSDVVVATGEPFSVIPPSIREPMDLEIKPAGIVPADEPFWQGIPCRFGRATIWLPSEESPGRLDRFSLLALMPEHDATGALPFVLLGMQFLTEHRGQLSLDCSRFPQTGTISFSQTD